MSHKNDKPKTKNLLPSSVQQNPAPVGKDSQDRKTQVRSQTDRIMEAFLKVLPSNYVSQVQGPFYTMQFQAAAERIADFQVTAQEIYADSAYDFTRPEFLFQVLGSLVFPDAPVQGHPTIEGDLTYRTFLQRMVELLLQGATKATVKSGIELLTHATVEVIEKAIESRLIDHSAWGFDDAFTFEVNVSRIAGSIAEGTGSIPLYGFPEEDPFVLEENVRLVLRALKPAHTLYDYRHLFKDAFGAVFSDSVSWEMTQYFYEDFRQFWLGAKEITSTFGETLTDRSLFSDPTRDFSSISAGAYLIIESGPNSWTASPSDEGHIGRFRVKEVRAFPVGTDATARVYTTSGGLSGTATVQDDVITDAAQDWGNTVEGETLTFSEGPNAGTYRLKTILGSNGGPVGFAAGPGTEVRVAPSLLRTERRMTVAASGQTYRVAVDRLGVATPQTVQSEDATLYFVR